MSTSSSEETFKDNPPWPGWNDEQIELMKIEYNYYKDLIIFTNNKWQTSYYNHYLDMVTFIQDKLENGPFDKMSPKIPLCEPLSDGKCQAEVATQTEVTIEIKKIILTPLFKWTHPDEWATPVSA